jgi:hypothetical protein
VLAFQSLAPGRLTQVMPLLVMLLLPLLLPLLLLLLLLQLLNNN